MPDVADLLREQSLTGLRRLAATDPKAYEDALVERVRGDLTRSVDEDFNRRGMLRSSARDAAIADALRRARLDAAVQAQQASLAALAQASGAAQNDMRLRQQGEQFSRSHGLAKRQLGQQKDIANLNAAVVGGGGILSSLARTFPTETKELITSGATGLRDVGRRIFGGGGATASGPGGGTMSPAARLDDLDRTPTGFDFGGEGIDFGPAPTPIDYGATGGAYSPPDYSYADTDYNDYDWGGEGGASSFANLLKLLSNW